MKYLAKANLLPGDASITIVYIQDQNGCAPHSMDHGSSGTLSIHIY